MNKTLRFMFASMLMMFGMTAMAQEVTLDLTTNDDWQFPTDYTTGENTYTNAAGIAITLNSADNGYKFMSGTNGTCLILGKQGATLTLPAFDFDVEKIVIYGNATASGKVTQNIFVGEDAVSTETTSAKVTQTYKIAENSQAAGTVYVLKVTNGNNTQISKIEIFKKGEGGDDPEPVEDEVITATVAEFNAAKVSETVWYQLTGVVKNLQAGDLYGNFDIEDETGSVYVYGLLSEKGGEKKKFQELAEEKGIQNGSKLTLIGTRGYYAKEEKIEVMNAYFVSVDNSGVEPEPQPEPVVFEGDGTQENPYTVADVKAMTEAIAEHVWVKGYIVGSLVSATQFSEQGVATNLALAATADEADAANTLPVQLPQGPMRENLNVVDNPENIGKEVKLCGTIETYFKVMGVKNVDQFEMDGVVVGIVELNANTQQQGAIYNLNGQRVQKAQKGLYIENGKKVVIK